MRKKYKKIIALLLAMPTVLSGCASDSVFYADEITETTVLSGFSGSIMSNTVSVRQEDEVLETSFLSVFVRWGLFSLPITRSLKK